MTKLESAESIITNNGNCLEVNCEDCCLHYKCSRYIKERDDKYDLQLAKQYKKENEMKEFKVGDRAKLNELAKTQSWYFGDTVMVVSIGEDNDVLLSNGELINVHWLEKVEEKPIAPPTPFPYNLQKGDKVLDYNDEERIFIEYRPELNNPFVLVDTETEFEYENNAKYDICTCYRIKFIPKYRAYTEPKLEWLKEKKKLLYCGEEVSISSICLNNTVRITTKDLGELGKKFTMEELFKNHTELDGTPFGEIIN